MAVRAGILVGNNKMVSGGPIAGEAFFEVHLLPWRPIRDLHPLPSARLDADIGAHGSIDRGKLSLGSEAKRHRFYGFALEAQQDQGADSHRHNQKQHNFCQSSLIAHHDIPVPMAVTYDDRSIRQICPIMHFGTKGYNPDYTIISTFNKSYLEY